MTRLNQTKLGASINKYAFYVWMANERFGLNLIESKLLKSINKLLFNFAQKLLRLRDVLGQDRRLNNGS